VAQHSLSREQQQQDDLFSARTLRGGHRGEVVACGSYRQRDGHFLQITYLFSSQSLQHSF
jgi:hypothetical protein